MRQNTPVFGGNRKPANPCAIQLKSHTNRQLSSQRQSTAPVFQLVCNKFPVIGYRPSQTGSAGLRPPRGSRRNRRDLSGSEIARDFRTDCCAAPPWLSHAAPLPPKPYGLERKLYQKSTVVLTPSTNALRFVGVVYPPGQMTYCASSFKFSHGVVCHPYQASVTYSLFCT